MTTSTEQQQTCLIQPLDDGTGHSDAVVAHAHAVPRLNDHDPYEVLIRVAAVALNPADHKTPKYDPTPGAIMGCDFVGTVVGAGSHASTLEITPGTRVCGLVHGSNPANPHNGAFAEFLVADARLLLRVPRTWSDVEAAALGGVGWMTVALTMADPDALNLEGRPSRPAAPRGNGSKTPVLVYGGSTATGTMACQLLSLSGYEPIATASKSSSALVTSYGALRVVPYTSPSAGETMRNMTAGSLRHALDCITTPESAHCCLSALGRLGGRYASLEHCPEEWRTRKAIHASMPMGYEAFGRPLKLKGVYARGASPAKFALAVEWRQEVQELLDRGRLRCHPPREIDGGWQGIVKGLHMLQNGEVHGEKLVVRLQ